MHIIVAIVWNIDNITSIDSPALCHNISFKRVICPFHLQVFVYCTAYQGLRFDHAVLKHEKQRVKPSRHNRGYAISMKGQVNEGT